jgi:crotonobetainyl-CoA:carnitine CoA-transferase CaiB-like acyl-CoA transferase
MTPAEGESAALLRGLVVVQWGSGVACSYAARMFADLGATVHRVDDGQEALDAARLAQTEPAAAFLDADKQSIPLEDGNEAARQELTTLLHRCDVLFEDWSARPLGEDRPPIDALRAANPRLVVVSVTPFGLSGPYAGWRAGDLEIAFLSGLAHLTPRDIARPAEGDLPPPLKMPGSLVSIYAGASAAACAMTGLYARDRGGRGVHADVSMLETLIPALRREVALCYYNDEVASRFMRVWRLAPYGVKACRDGFVFLQVVESYHWEGLVDMMGSPSWALDRRYLDPEFRFEHRHDLEARIAPWLLEQTKREFAFEAQRRGVPFAPINELQDLLQIPQLHHRRFFRATGGPIPAIVPGVPFKLAHSDVPVESPAGSTRPFDASAGPLAGLRVIDFGHVWAGPYCAALLADMGAEVIKVESQRRIDIHRRQGPYAEGRPGVNRSGVWNTQNRGKRSVTLNLSAERGRELARELVATADVAIENFAPGVLRRLGLDYETLSAKQPRLVMASLSAFGQDGPQSGFIGYGPSLDAWAGLDRMTAYEGGAPNALGGVFPDTGSAIHAAALILAGLRARDETGRGTYIDLSELEVSILLLGDLVSRSINGQQTPVVGNSHERQFPHGCFRCAGTDRWVALSVPDIEAWRGLCRVLQRGDWASDPSLSQAEGRRARVKEIEGAITAWTAVRQDTDAMRELQEAGVPAGIANTAATLLTDPQLRAREYFQVVEHPEAGPQPMYGPIWRFDGNVPRLRGPAPVLGADTHYVLSSLLGLSRQEIAALEADQVAF